MQIVLHGESENTCTGCAYTQKNKRGLSQNVQRQISCSQVRMTLFEWGRSHAPYLATLLYTCCSRPLPPACYSDMTHKSSHLLDSLCEGSPRRHSRTHVTCVDFDKCSMICTNKRMRSGILRFYIKSIGLIEATPMIIAMSCKLKSIATT